jgi:hypothetical protein
VVGDSECGNLAGELTTGLGICLYRAAMSMWKARTLPGLSTFVRILRWLRQ